VSVDQGIWDCHLHIFAESDDRVESLVGYTLDDYLHEVAVPLSISNVVFVQPSKLGADHSVLFDGLHRMAGRARAVAVLPEDDEKIDLDAWHALGVRGLRYAPRLGQGGRLEQLINAAPALSKLKWHVQVYADVDVLPGIVEKLINAGVPVVLDHFARLAPDVTLGRYAMGLVLETLKTGTGWIKFSAPYHFSDPARYFADLTEIAGELFHANPNRILWGTDWPHPNVREPVNELRLLQALDVWGFSDADKSKLLLENPVALYDPKK
jgi:predicted TIM-barrel fold metal-dependent hydrolase